MFKNQNNTLINNLLFLERFYGFNIKKRVQCHTFESKDVHCIDNGTSEKLNGPAQIANKSGLRLSEGIQNLIS